MANFKCDNWFSFTVVTPSKLYRESLKLGMRLNSEALSGFRKKPPALYAFDGKIMKVKSHTFDSRGTAHPVQNKKDQIGEADVKLSSWEQQNKHLLLVTLKIHYFVWIWQ